MTKTIVTIIIMILIPVIGLGVPFKVGQWTGSVGGDTTFGAYWFSGAIAIFLASLGLYIVVCAAILFIWACSDLASRIIGGGDKND